MDGRRLEKKMKVSSGRRFRRRKLNDETSFGCLAARMRQSFIRLVGFSFNA